MKTVGIVGAGISGLLACRHVLQKGLRPVVFEAEDSVGGVWTRTLRTTELQTPKYMYQFRDFPWPEEVDEEHPKAEKVLAYIESYAREFDLLRHVRFSSRVVEVEYVGATQEEMEAWALWGGTGHAFGRNNGFWRLTVHPSEGASEVFEVDFLILCLGRFSGLPNMPSFPPNKGPEVFQGRAMHSMDYSNLDNSSSIELLKGKKTVVVGYSKSAMDVAMECADANGASNPCTLIYRESTRWVLPNCYAWSAPVLLLYLSSFGELLVHKPGEGILLSILATLLSPLKWLICQAAQCYFKWKMPIAKYGLAPKQSLDEDLAASAIAILPDRFYERLEQGSIVPKRSSIISFYEGGVTIDDRERVPADVVIFATGFKGDQKIWDIFASQRQRELLMGSSSSLKFPLYRDCIHPRIPQLAIVGYCESLSNLYTSEMRCIWLMQLLDNGFQLPTIKAMEEDVKKWQEYESKYGKGNLSIGCIHNWYNDQLFKETGVDPRRNKGPIGNWITAYRQ